MSALIDGRGDYRSKDKAKTRTSSKTGHAINGRWPLLCCSMKKTRLEAQKDG